MLGTVLDKLGGWLSKAFLFGSFFPVLIFTALNGMWYWIINPDFGNELAKYFAMPATKQVYLLTTLLIGVAVVAYVLWSLSTLLREVLEGKHGWPSFLQSWVSQVQRNRLASLNKKIEDASTNRRELARDIKWLQDQRLQGRAKVAKYAGLTDSLAARAKTLHDEVNSGAKVTPQQFKAWVDHLGVQLALTDADSKPDGDLLDQNHVALWRLLVGAQRRWDQEYSAAFSERELNFGSGEPAPTAMGNIAASLQDYGVSRYNLNMETFWTRLLKIIQGHDKDFEMVQQTKGQLDFLVSSWWLATTSTAFWLVWMTMKSYYIERFILVAIMGPTVMYAAYGLAVNAYRSFADVMRSLIDFYRFELLVALHIGLPDGIRAERQLWDTLNLLSTYGDRDLPSVHYQHPKTP
jgi:hypothetical protein